MKKSFSIQWLPIAILLGSASAGLVDAADAAKAFSAPEAAVLALSEAASATNRAALTALFGPAASQLVNPDEVQGARELAEFTAALSATNRLVRESDTRSRLEIGAEHWPFPIPLVKTEGGWHFDTEAGLQELLNRRIGRNELEVLAVVRSYVDAQREYASRDRDGDDVLEYAQQLRSSAGKTDGLYWPPELNGETSPLGPLMAQAQREGYTKKAEGEEPQPFHGYFFQILTRQGKHAPGGKYDYIINGNMIGGFALIAWPAEYGESGIMTFIVNQQGKVYQRDLGESTAKAVKRIQTYDPDNNWDLSVD